MVLLAVQHIIIQLFTTVTDSIISTNVYESSILNDIVKA